MFSRHSQDRSEEQSSQGAGGQASHSRARPSDINSSITEASLARRPPCKVLAVDDMATGRALVKIALEAPAWEVIEAGGGEQALQLISEFSFDLILLDVNMPNVDGIDVLRAIRETRSQITLPVIMLTSIDEVDKTVELLELGANDYVPKPFDPRLLQARAETQLAQKALKDELSQSEARYRIVFENIRDVVFRLDEDGRVTMLNPVWESMTGLTVDDSLGHSFAERIGVEHREEAEQKIARLLSQGEAWNQSDLRLLTDSSDDRWVDVRATGLLGQNGAILGAVGVLHDVTERRRREEQTRHMAHHDALTGVPNRALFQEMLPQILAGARRRQEVVSLLILDLNRFKEVNDTFGHTAGDGLLKAFAQRILMTVRESDLVVRLGGDEFAVVAPSLPGTEGGLTLADRLIAAVDEPFQIGESILNIRTTIGIAFYPKDSEIIEDLMQMADLSLYHAKETSPGSHFCFNPEIQERFKARVALEKELREALERREFIAYYQPQVDLESRRIIGVEVLARWLHPERGIVSPGEFIQVAEQSGLIGPISEQVMRRAAEESKTWNNWNGQRISIAVNLSAAQLQDDHFVNGLSTMLKDCDFDPEFLEFELTESVMFEAFEPRILNNLHRLNALGIRLSIDDFGTGFGSLIYLQKFPVSKIKIDLSFVQGMLDNPVDAEIVRAVIGLGQGLKLHVVAEGVETEALYKALRQAGCNSAQGYYFARPMPADEMTRLIGMQPLPATTT